MKRSTKKGFTIVELVIVIAVIAILAAVLIPTFSSLIKRANLSADMQAVRTINLALQTHEAKNGKPANVDQAMLIIADAGYDVATYHPLTKGYEIYWVDTVNRVILYSTTDTEVVYPEDYVELTNNSSWHYLNESYKNAVKYDFSDIVSGDGKTYDMSELSSEAAGDALYAAFVRMTETNLDNKIDNDVKIVLPEKVDVSDYIWKPVKEFKGELKGASEATPTVISGVTLDESVSFSQSVPFSGGIMTNGEPSRYNVYGFIDVVSGKATIENITFENFKLTTPGGDYATAVSNNSNVLAPIGCIIPDLANPDVEADVVIRNVTVKDSTIEGLGRVAGLVGYIGGFGGSENSTLLGGAVKIENCKVDNCVIEGGLGEAGRGTAGGLIGYLVRLDNEKGFKLEIKDCSVTNTTIKGTQTATSLIGLYSAEGNKDCWDRKDENGKTYTELSKREIYIYGTNDFTTGNKLEAGAKYYELHNISYGSSNTNETNILNAALIGSLTFNAPPSEESGN